MSTTEAYERELCRAGRGVAAPAVARRGGRDSSRGLPGGHSGLTYRVETSEGALVVKAVPPGQRPIGRHDMLRQARIIGRAGARPRCRCPAIVATDESEPAWFAMELVAGESLEPVLDDPAVAPALAAARMLRAAEMLPAAARRTARQGPGRRAEPLVAADELDRWARTMAAVPPDLVPGAERLHQRLADSVPAAVDPDAASTATTGSAT